MYKNKILLSSIAALTILSSHATAQDTELQAVDVWETEVVSSSLNLGKDAIETKQADHLSDLLRDLPGVDVGGTHSINNRLNIRGLQDENLDITVDGAKVSNVNMFHHIGNLLINPDILKKADIQVGTNSVVSGSLGGSAAFETKSGAEMLEKGKSFGARISSTYNSNDSISGSFAGYGKISETFDFLIYHNHLNKNDWKDGRGVKTFGTDGKSNNTLIKIGANINDNNKLFVSYDRLKDAGDYSPRPDFGRDYNFQRTGKDTYDTKYTRETITLKHELDLGDKLRVDTTIYSNENELDRYEGPLSDGAPVRPGGVFEGQLLGKVKTVGINTKAQTNLNTGNILHTLTYGALYDRQTSKVTWNGDKYGENERANTFALYLEDAIDFDNGLVLTPGIRYNKYDLDGANGNVNDSRFTYGLAAEYAVTDEFSFLASATTLYKGVEMVDVLATNRLSGSSNATKGIKSETGINKEIGFRFIKDNVIGADTVGWSFKIFETEINNYIENKWGPGWAYNYLTNVGDVKINGFETSFKYIKGDFSSLLTYAHSSSNRESDGDPLINEPGDSLTLGIDYQITPEVGLSWESLFVMSENDVPKNTPYTYNEKKAYNVHDIAVKWKPRAVKGLSIIAGVDNIFDEEYSSHISESRTLNLRGGGSESSRDYEPGRNFKVTLSYKF